MRNIGTFDHIIVGAGTAGCVLANRLSGDGRSRVLLLEAGGRDSYPWIHIPVGYLHCIGNPRTDWRFVTRPEPGLGGRSLGYPRGKVLGGSSSINGMLVLRGQAADYDHWAQLGNLGWGWQDVLPYFLRSEDYAPGADALHAVGGEWRVEEQRLRWDILDAFQAACVAAGIPAVADFNRGDNFGVGRFMVNQKRGLRWSAARGFLRPALKRENLRVVTGAHIERVMFEGKRAAGVRFRRKGAVQQAVAAREVILAAGAIGSPQILQLSGVGPVTLLRGLGIEVVHGAEGVGENLQDHLQLRCAYRVEGVDTLNELASTWLGKARIVLEYALKRSGPMSMAPSQLCAFAYSGEDVATPDLEYHVQPLSLSRFGEPLDDFPAFTASVCQLRPEARGHVRITSADPLEVPEIAPNYLSTEADRRRAVAAIRLTRRIVAQAPLAQYRPAEFRPGWGDSDADLVAAAGEVGTTIFHPVGTARMGIDPGSVVDPQLRVRGVAGLRVIDASIMPRITSGNTNTPVVMIAEKGAAMVLGDRR